MELSETTKIEENRKISGGQTIFRERKLDLKFPNRDRESNRAFKV